MVQLAGRDRSAPCSQEPQSVMSLPDRPAAAARPWSVRLARGVWRVARLALVVYLGVVILLTCLQRQLIYGPKRVASLALPQVDARVHVEPVIYRSDDGLSLHGWHFESRRLGGKGAQPVIADKRPVVLYFPGNAMHRGYRLREFELLTHLGAEVYCFDYRGYAENPGHPTQIDLIRDAHAAWIHLTVELSIPASQIVLFGESLGGGVATPLAADLCQRGDAPGGLILRSTFTSLVDVAGRLFGWLPVRWMLFDRFLSIDRVGSVTCPLLMLHGDQDEVVPFELGRKLFAAARDESSSGFSNRFVTLPGAGHNDYLECSGELVSAALGDFLRDTQLLKLVVRQDAMIENLPVIRDMVYPADRTDDLSPEAFECPEGRVLSITTRTEDGLELHGWHLISGREEAATREQADQLLADGRPVVLFFGGNGGHRAYRLPEDALILQAGADIFHFDYRGYGDNAGQPSEAGLALDARAAWSYAVHERRIAPHRIVLYGESLGGAVAVRLASELTGGNRPGGLVLRSTFTSMSETARLLYPMLKWGVPAGWYPSIDRIGKVECPVLIMHGERDTLVPFEMGTRLFAAAPAVAVSGEVKRLVPLPLADHNDVVETEGIVMAGALREFLARREVGR